MNSRLFTSESVAIGHPDKICDQISDAVLDSALYQDPKSRVAIETAVKGDQVMVFGELTTNGVVDISQIVRDTLTRIGYDDPYWGFEPWRVKQFHNITGQSREIADAVTNGDGTDLGAGDQGIMFGYAVKETQMMMPLPLTLARNITTAQSVMRDGILGPDAKAQVTVRYGDDGNPINIDTIVLSSVHRDIKYAMVIDKLHSVIEAGLNKPDEDFTSLLTKDTKIIINPAGKWITGGPLVDSGLTGRKIIVDTYGGAARHGGGCFSGKSPDKVDRSAAYAARRVAKTLCDKLGRHRTEVQVSYAIGIPEPVSVHVYGMHEDAVTELLDHYNIDLTPTGIITQLDLYRQTYVDTAGYGHFGDVLYPWEIIPLD